MSIDPYALTVAVFDRLSSDLAGAAVRAMLGAGNAAWNPPLTTSVIAADKLNKASLPQTPLVALRRLPIGGETNEMRACTWQWWIYDDPSEGRWRVNKLAGLLPGAYGMYSIPYGRLTTGIGGDGADSALGGLLFTTVRIVYTRRG